MSSSWLCKPTRDHDYEYIYLHSIEFIGQKTTSLAAQEQETPSILFGGSQHHLGCQYAWLPDKLRMQCRTPVHSIQGTTVN